MALARALGLRAVTGSAGRFLATLCCASLVGVPCDATTILSLGFDSLPTAQGWLYEGTANETDVYFVDGTKLTLDTIGLGLASALYTFPGAVPPTPFSVLLRARVLQDDNEGLLALSALTGTEHFRFRLSADSLMLGASSFPFNGTEFHDFRLEISPADGTFDLFVDGVPFASSSAVPLIGFNTLFFGDADALDAPGDNVLAEITRLDVVPGPSTAVLLVAALVSLAVSRRCLH